ncbi:MAG: TIGR03067 domain-containing protein [Pirellulales bacterium]
MKLSLWIALAAVCLVAADPQADADKAKRESRERRNLQRWQGTFEAVSIVVDGKVTPPEQLKNRKLTVKGNKYKFENGDFQETGSYKWDVMKEPREVDIVVESGPDKGKVWTAIYSTSEQGLMICLDKDNKKRPTATVALPGSNVINEVWKKVSK